MHWNDSQDPTNDVAPDGIVVVFAISSRLIINQTEQEDTLQNEQICKLTVTSIIEHIDETE